MSTWALNTIATRIAVTLVLAIILGVALDVVIGFGIAYFSDPSARVIGSPSALYVFNARRQALFVFPLGRNSEMLASRVATAISLVEATPEMDRPRVISAVTRPGLRIELRDSPLPGLEDTGTGNLDIWRRLIAFLLGDPEQPVIVAARPLTDDLVGDGGIGESARSSGADALLVEKALPDGRWLLVTVPEYQVAPVPPFGIAVWLVAIFALIGLLSLLAARRLATPIATFARAAERLGVDSTVPPLEESGPQELRSATRAFNRMQERLRRFVDDRTQMLAAMSHDLRTPLNRLRLRAEFIDDEEQQRKMFSDLEAMNVMIDTTLAFVRDDSRREPRALVDLGVLVEDACEDAVDAGASVSYSGPRGVNAWCAPHAVSRAVANLVDNAIKYAGAARVSLAQEPERVIIAIEDDGPGIPGGELERVFAPFYRLERSRNADTGGVGLGLSVARTVAREHGGDVTVANREGGGLCARMELPQGRSPNAPSL